MTIQELIDKLDHDDLGVRLTARNELAKIGIDAVPRLIKTIATSQGRKCWVAAKLLGQIGDKVAVHTLIEALEADNPILRETAASALGDLNDRRAIPALCRALSDPHVQVQLHAAIALSRIGDRYAVPHLIYALSRSGHELSKCTFIEALSELGDNSAVKYIMEYADDESAHVRKRVVEALERLQNASNV